MNDLRPFRYTSVREMKPIRITCRFPDGSEHSFDGEYNPLTDTVSIGRIAVSRSILAAELKSIYCVELISTEVSS